MTTVPNGIIGDILAAGLLRLIGGEQSVDNATASGTGDHPQSRRWTGGLSMIYGAVDGGALLLLERHVLGVLAVPPSVLEALGTTLVGRSEPRTNRHLRHDTCVV